MESNDLVSVIIPTYNSQESLEICLESIYNQSHKSIEIIIVDNFSNDDTQKIAKTYNAIIIENKSERATARNIGIKKAKGIYILSIDSDMELEKEVISDCINKCKRHKKAGGVIIPEISVGSSFWVIVRNYERGFYEHTKIESARFFKKDIIDIVGGYEESIVFFEESTVPQKIESMGYDTSLRIDSHIIHHEEKFNFLLWLKKKFYYAQHIGDYQKKYSKYASDQINPFYRFEIYLNNKEKSFFSNPFLAFGVIILKSLEYLFSALGYLSSKI